jgi:hypothetical protein
MSSHSRPCTPHLAVIQELSTHIQRLEAEIEAAQGDILDDQSRERYHRQHRLYMLQREMLDYRLSRRLNELKLGMQGRITPAFCSSRTNRSPGSAGS